MLKTVAQTLKRHCNGKFLYNIARVEKSYPHSVFMVRRINMLDVHPYSTRTVVSEEETFSYKIQEHIRVCNHTDYAVSRSRHENKLSFDNVSDWKYAIEKALLLIAHNPEVSVKETLHLFSLYADSGQLVNKNVIANRELMQAVQRKVIECIKLMSVHEMQQLALSLRKLGKQNAQFFRAVERCLAQYCEIKAVESGILETIQLFDVLLILFGNNVKMRKEYDTFLQLFEQCSTLSDPQKLVAVLHYTGLRKKRNISTDFINNIVRKLEPNFSNLSFFDAGIAASAMFKLGVNLDRSSLLVEKIALHLLNKMKESCKLDYLEFFALVSMIKFLRYKRYEDDEVYCVLSEYICKNNENEVNLTPNTIPHILAFYASSRVYNKELFSKLENLMFKHLKDQLSSLRIKDISSLLWCFSHTGHNCSPQFYTLIDKRLTYCHLSQMRKDHHLSDSLLSLAICDHYPEDLIKIVFAPEQINRLQGYQRSKQLSRLWTLYEALKIEAPNLSVEKPKLCGGDLPTRTLSDEIHHRPLLSKVMEGVECINEILGANVLKLKFLIPSINYANLVVDFNHLQSIETTTSDSCLERAHILEQLSVVKGDSVAIEILEPYFLIKQTLEPIGFIRLKLRLLCQKGWSIKTVTCSELQEYGNDTRAIAALLLDKFTKT